MLHLQVLDLTHVVPVLECLFWYIGMLADSRPEPRYWSIRPIFTQQVSCLLSPLIPLAWRALICLTAVLSLGCLVPPMAVLQGCEVLVTCGERWAPGSHPLLGPGGELWLGPARNCEGPWLRNSVPTEHSAHVEHVEHVLTSVVT